MKRLILLIIMLFFVNLSQSQNYDNLWITVKQFESERLPKSALKIVEEIAIKANTEKNAPQFIKTLFFKSKFALVLEEDAQLKIITDFKNQIKHSTFPTKNILESLLANLYWQYFEQNRWPYYNRTKTSKKIDATDFRTWDLQTLFNEVHIHFKNSLKNGLMLQKQDLRDFDTLLTLQNDSKIYRPTLFDFLNHQALAFYKSKETNITKPAYKFEIDSPEFLSDAKTFSTLQIQSKDSTSLQLNALKIYQDLIQFHLHDKDPYALADVNIERLKFVNENASFNNKETLFLNTLKTESTRLKTHEVSGLYDFEIAQIYYQQSTQYNPKTDQQNRWKAKEAMAICNQVRQTFPNSKAAQKSHILKTVIEQQTLQIITEHFLPIEKYARVLVNYKNIDSLSFQVFKISNTQLQTFNKLYNKEEKLTFIKNLQGTKSWEHILKNEGDYQTHSTEVVVPKLNNGLYLIFSTVTNSQKNYAFTTLQVTNLAWVETDSELTKIFQIIDRNNGMPISNAKVELSYFKNNSQEKQTEKFTTNSLGEITFKKTRGNYSHVSAKVTNSNDTAYFGNFYLGNNYPNNQIKNPYKSFLFTDRSIYRPGQIVYFKAITMKTEKGQSDVLANESVYAVLYNVNSEKISRLEFKTNEFGSVSGEFVIPNNGLNGQYYIVFDGIDKKISTEHYFSVEEYKRPKFETKLKPVTETYKVNDSITIKGLAVAFAGSNITHAQVVYRVHRKVHYPRWYYWYKPWFTSELQEITHGKSITNEKGEFEVTFKAIPDTQVDKASLPIFNYEITVAVTDINGETQTTTTFVNVGYHTLVANLNGDTVLDKNKKNHSITIDTKNLNNEFVAAKGTLKIYKLKAPNSVLRPRPWAAPDYQELSEETFKNLFPHEAYSNEDNSNNWKKGRLVLEKTFDTETSKIVELGRINNWQSGQYSILLESQDTFGQLVKDEMKISLYSDKDKTIADNQLFSITSDKPNYSAGDIATITLATAIENVSITLIVEKNQNTVKKELIKLNNNKKTITIPVNDNDIGGFSIHYSYAAYNSFKSGSLNIAVPYSKTQLDIETITFRDKLEPGTPETWEFKIKGPLGDHVSAELLASMYDASLDQFKPHEWRFNPIEKPLYKSRINSRATHSFGTSYFTVYNNPVITNYLQQNYDQWNWFGFYFRTMRYAMKSLESRVSNMQMVEDNVAVEETSFSMINQGSLNEVVSVDNNTSIEQNSTEKQNLNPVSIRKNLQETAFFFPHLQTDNLGNVSFSFTTPEALTQWKLQLLAHTKTLESATKTLTAVTQKELMVIPNAPRFLREGDKITISTKIANLTNKQLSGEAILILTNAITGKDITEKWLNSSLSKKNNTSSFTVNAKENTQVSWSLTISDDIQAIQYKIIAKSGNFTDGEQNTLPVLSNRILVTETLPMWIPSNQTKTFTLDKLHSNTSKTLKNHKLTLEITSNPAWYAVQALPYLMEYPYECNEQIFSQYFANALASHIANSNPRIQEVFNQWKNADVLISNLEKNDELKSIIIQETPWVRNAQSETEQKKRIALLFDLNKMKMELEMTISKLKNNQMSSGAWAWFTGGNENRYITQHIISGFGHLKHLKVAVLNNEQMIKTAIKYLDSEFVKDYKNLKKYNPKADLNKNHLSFTQIHYLYMRSMYSEIKKSKEVEEIINYYQTQIQKYWTSGSLYSKGLMALISHRKNDAITATKILNSLRETSITSAELGMYWKENTNSWFWYQAPIETQALLIEAFSEIENDTKTSDNLKVWLLKNKQTNHWKTTKATTHAVYALLLQGSDWLSVTDMVDVVVGKQKIEPSELEHVKIEAGTGYYKTSWDSSDIKPEMGKVTLSKKGNGIAWGGLYWQYFEDLDNITFAETPLKLRKKLFLKTNTNMGLEISEITENTVLKVGDLITVRIELKSDRSMEFIHMKDLRASGFEPINVISKYKWQDGLGYYESTKDASTNFFFDYVPKGVFVFEYDLRVNNAGVMSNGITSIQSMYAPEFYSHSNGYIVNVKN